jgi:hypothetical protein
VFVWTGATRDPSSVAPSMGDCGAWSSSAGSMMGRSGESANSTDQQFYDVGQSCSDPNTHLYCLER